ncbi:MAG TPA: class I SAM-dependent methyltransferase [Nitrososphaerales archaeon]|nr:class I SAM-dependent methyltransferase [Nitrososphaerales archaeon]
MVGSHVAETSSKITGYVIGAVKRVIPPSAQPGATRLFDGATNSVERVLGWREDLTPPLRIRLHIGPFLDPRLYRFAGDQNVEGFKVLAGLKPDANFLDIACGCGRVARSLTKYLAPTATYEGFDAAKKPVEWAQGAITPRFPNFHFRTADTFNKRYNPSGRTSAADTIFPYEDDKFDFAFAGSLYTHQLPEEVANFVAETKRVLKPGGVTFATFCLLNDKTRPIVEEGKSMPRLVYKYGDCMVRTTADPAHFIAHPEQWVRDLYAKVGLNIVEPIERGTWAVTTPQSGELEKYRLGGSPSRSASQDAIIAVKR